MLGQVLKTVVEKQTKGLGSIPFNLQMFAEAGGTAGGNDGGGTTAGDNTVTPPPTDGGQAEGDKTFDDLLKDKKYQSEFDKKVAKALEAAKNEWEVEHTGKLETVKTEAEKLAKMNAAEKAKYEQQKTVD
ncbi:MAG: DUF4355 domain-containing protein, partial [Clostridium sp.]